MLQSLTTEAHLNAVLRKDDEPKETAPTADVVAATVKAAREKKVSYVLLSSCCLPCTYCVVMSTHYFPDCVVQVARHGDEASPKGAAACQGGCLHGFQGPPRGGK